MGYYINQINNSYNKYKYQYLDHMVATIDLRQNYWDFNMQLIMINDCYLPLNSLLVNLALPYQDVKNLTFNLASDQSQASKMVDHNMKYAKIYESKFSIDISNNEYLKQDLNNAKLSTTINLEIDPEPITKAKTEIKQEDLDGLIIETAEQKWSYEMYYTNTHVIEQSMVLNNTYGYDITKNGKSFAKVRLINTIVDNYEIMERPVIDLIRFQSPIAFKIEQAKVKFHYWIESNSEEKTLEADLDVQKSFVNDIVIKFNKKTLYDFNENKVIIDETGIDGFYVPKHTNGYYSLELKLAQDNDIVKCLVKNNFMFNTEINKPHIETINTRLDNIDDFKLMEV